MCPRSVAVAGDRTPAFSWTQPGGSQSPSSGVWSPALSGQETAALGSPGRVTSGFGAFCATFRTPDLAGSPPGSQSKSKSSLGKKKQIRGNIVNLILLHAVGAQI